jgi:hypothetical protein
MSTSERIEQIRKQMADAISLAGGAEHLGGAGCTAKMITVLTVHVANIEAELEELKKKINGAR